VFAKRAEGQVGGKEPSTPCPSMQSAPLFVRLSQSLSPISDWPTGWLSVCLSVCLTARTSRAQNFISTLSPLRRRQTHKF